MVRFDVTVGDDPRDGGNQAAETGSDREGTPSLPADHAFVVQFRPGAGPVGPERGRAEHLVSGTAAMFTTWAELRQFVERALKATCAQSEAVDPLRARSRR